MPYKNYASMPLHRKQAIRASRRRWTRENIRLIREAKNKPCSDCSIKYPWYVMDFDHVRGEKKFNLSQCAARSKTLIMSEIAKCDVVCANCHRERGHKRGLSKDVINGW